MKPTVPGSRLGPTTPPLSPAAQTMLAILDHFGVKSGGSLPFKPIIARWSKVGGRGGADAASALEELATAGVIEPFDDNATTVVRC